MKGSATNSKLELNAELNRWIRKSVFKEADTDRALRVAFYIRAYSQEQDGIKQLEDHADMWREQYDHCCALAEELGLEPPSTKLASGEDLAEYIDHCPARLNQQRALRSMLKRLITKRDIDVVITSSWSRLSRNQVDSFYIQQAIESSGAQLLVAGDVLVLPTDLVVAA